MAIISNATTIADAGSFSVGLGDMVHIKTVTASNSSTVSFVHGTSNVVLDGTYPIYMVSIINAHCSQQSGDGEEFTVNFRDGGSAFDAAKTATYISASSPESGSGATVAYRTSHDVQNGTGAQNIFVDQKGDNDAAGVVKLFLFNPAGTTFWKQYVFQGNYMHSSPSSLNPHAGGLIRVTSAIDGIQFAMSAGNIESGTFKLYGLKDS